MDINMNNVNFKKFDDDNWVYLTPDGIKVNGIRVFYDDGTLQATEGMADYSEGYLKDIANKNDWTDFDNFKANISGLC